MAKKITKYIIAVKDYDNTVKKLVAGKLNMERDAKVYKDIFDGVIFTCNSYEGLKKFIKQNKYNKKDCMHYWEGLVTADSTLVTFEYDAEDENFIENSCDNDNIVYISSWTK